MTRKLLVTLLAASCLGACRGGHIEQAYLVYTGGSPVRGNQAIVRRNCGSCHTIPGVHGADGEVGPPLMRIGRRTFIAGHLSNSPENLLVWLHNPQSVSPGTAMPNLGLGDQEARDISAYLYTLR